MAAQEILRAVRQDESEGHITRLTRPGHEYFNLNPWYVLDIPHNSTLKDVKKAYRNLSLRVHPDKNGNTPESQEAFDAVKKAYEMMQDDKKVAKCARIVQNARDRITRQEEAKVLDAKRRGEVYEPLEGEELEEARKIMVSKIFADMEMEKIRREKLHQAETDAQQEEMERLKMKRKRQAEDNEEWDKTREVRVNSWQDFQKAKRKKKKRRLQGTKRMLSDVEKLQRDIMTGAVEAPAEPASEPVNRDELF